MIGAIFRAFHTVIGNVIGLGSPLGLDGQILRGHGCGDGGAPAGEGVAGLGGLCVECRKIGAVLFGDGIDGCAAIGIEGDGNILGLETGIDLHIKVGHGEAVAAVSEGGYRNVVGIVLTAYGHHIGIPADRNICHSISGSGCYREGNGTACICPVVGHAGGVQRDHIFIGNRNVICHDNADIGFRHGEGILQPELAIIPLVFILHRYIRSGMACVLHDARNHITGEVAFLQSGHRTLHIGHRIFLRNGDSAGRSLAVGGGDSDLGGAGCLGGDLATLHGRNRFVAGSPGHGLVGSIGGPNGGSQLRFLTNAQFQRCRLIQCNTGFGDNLLQHKLLIGCIIGNVVTVICAGELLADIRFAGCNGIRICNNSAAPTGYIHRHRDRILGIEVFDGNLASGIQTHIRTSASNLRPSGQRQTGIVAITDVIDTVTVTLGGGNGAAVHISMSDIFNTGIGISANRTAVHLEGTLVIIYRVFSFVTFKGSVIQQERTRILEHIADVIYDFAAIHVERTIVVGKIIFIAAAGNGTVCSAIREGKCFSIPNLESGCSRSHSHSMTVQAEDCRITSQIHFITPLHILCQIHIAFGNVACAVPGLEGHFLVACFIAIFLAADAVDMGRLGRDLDVLVCIGGSLGRGNKCTGRCFTCPDNKAISESGSGIGSVDHPNCTIAAGCLHTTVRDRQGIIKSQTNVFSAILSSSCFHITVIPDIHGLLSIDVTGLYSTVIDRVCPACLHFGSCQGTVRNREVTVYIHFCGYRHIRNCHAAVGIKLPLLVIFL